MKIVHMNANRYKVDSVIEEPFYLTKVEILRNNNWYKSLFFHIKIFMGILFFGFALIALSFSLHIFIPLFTVANLMLYPLSFLILFNLIFFSISSSVPKLASLMDWMCFISISFFWFSMDRCSFEWSICFSLEVDFKCTTYFSLV